MITAWFRSRSARVATLSALLLLTACESEKVEATQVLIRVDSELQGDAVSHQVRVSDESEQLVGDPATIIKPPPFSFAVVPASKFPARTNLVSVSALDAAGNVLVTTKTLITFVKRKTVLVDMRINRACVNVPCASGLNCVPSSAGGGECLPIQLTTGKEIPAISMEGSEFMEGAKSDAGSRNTDPSGAPPPETSSAMTTGTEPDTQNSEASVPASEAGISGANLRDAGSLLVDAGPPPACDATRPCSTGLVCENQVCVSACQPPCETGASCEVVNNVGHCTCQLQASSRCDNGNLFWFDSCGNRGAQRQACTNGCAQGACQAPVTLTLNITGGGRIDFADSTGSCTASGCKRMVSAGTQVVLTATPSAAGQWMTGWSGPCTGQDECRFAATNDVTVMATFGSANIIFTTAATFPANMGSRARTQSASARRRTATRTRRGLLAGPPPLPAGSAPHGAGCDPTVSRSWIAFRTFWRGSAGTRRISTRLARR
jgi:hypothetical protein